FELDQFGLALGLRRRRGFLDLRQGGQGGRRKQGQRYRRDGKAWSDCAQALMHGRKTAGVVEPSVTAFESRARQDGWAGSSEPLADKIESRQERGKKRGSPAG